jgi:hypothetical protein
MALNALVLFHFLLAPFKSHNSVCGRLGLVDKTSRAARLLPRGSLIRSPFSAWRGGGSATWVCFPSPYRFHT